MYQRVLLKISGEALSSENAVICSDTVQQTVSHLKALWKKGIQIGVVVGGGNIMRGRSAEGMERNRADHMGMLATAINALALQDALERAGVPCAVLSAVDMNRFCDSYSARSAKKLLSEGRGEFAYKADDKFDVVVLDKKEVTYSYFADPMYVFMDADYNQYEVEAENMDNAIKYLEDGMPCEVVFYNDKAISVELPTSLVRTVEYTEPAVKGDTSSGRVLKNAKINDLLEIQVPLFVNTGDKIEIDTRDDSYRSRV